MGLRGVSAASGAGDAVAKGQHGDQLKFFRYAQEVFDFLLLLAPDANEQVPRPSDQATSSIC